MEKDYTLSDKRSLFFTVICVYPILIAVSYLILGIVDLTKSEIGLGLTQIIGSGLVFYAGLSFWNFKRWARQIYIIIGFLGVIFFFLTIDDLWWFPLISFVILMIAFWVRNKYGFVPFFILLLISISVDGNSWDTLIPGIMILYGLMYDSHVMGVFLEETVSDTISDVV